MAAFAVFVLMALATGCAGRSISTTGYAAVNGLKVYYEIHGAGQPLVLLHGTFGSIKTEFGKILPTFANARRVIAVELQGHGYLDAPMPKRSNHRC